MKLPVLFLCCALSISACGGGNDSYTPPAPSVPHVGDDVTLFVNQGLVVIAPTEAAYDAFVKASVADDKMGMAQLLGSGLIFTVPSGTRAKKIDTSMSGTKVRILTGEHAGDAGWVPDALVN